MIKVAFVLTYVDDWAGGLHYVKNLLYALSSLKDKEIEIIVFTGRKNKKNITSIFNTYGKIIPSYQFDSIVDRPYLIRYFFKAYKLLIQIIFRLKYFDYLLLKHDISIVSHSESCYGDPLKYKVINWIPDFQHIYLPAMFSQKEIDGRNIDFVYRIIKSSRVIVSSFSAYKDCKKFVPFLAEKARVLQFVCPIDKTAYTEDPIENIKKKYSIKKKFFYLPNQFWQHKNHKVVFQAIKIAKDKKIDMLLICSGFMKDYRHKNHVNDIQKMIKDLEIEKNIKILGYIDHKEVLSLMRNCISVINPSVFEGWSTTVEEAKSLGKNIILSDIPVHHEQNPPQSIYFNPHDPYALAEILIKKWQTSNGGPDLNLEKTASVSIQRRIKKFGSNYIKILYELIDKKS